MKESDELFLMQLEKEYGDQYTPRKIIALFAEKFPASFWTYVSERRGSKK